MHILKRQGKHSHGGHLRVSPCCPSLQTCLFSCIFKALLHFPTLKCFVQKFPFLAFLTCIIPMLMTKQCEQHIFLRGSVSPGRRKCLLNILFFNSRRLVWPNQKILMTSVDLFMLLQQNLTLPFQKNSFYGTLNCYFNTLVPPNLQSRTGFDLLIFQVVLQLQTHGQIYIYETASCETEYKLIKREGIKLLSRANFST